MKSQKEETDRTQTTRLKIRTLAGDEEKDAISHHKEKQANKNVSEESVNFKLDLQLDNQEEVSSIIEMIRDKFDYLQQNVSLISFELKLFARLPDREEKTAELCITHARKQFKAESNSQRWDNAFLNAYDKICGELIP